MEIMNMNTIGIQPPEVKWFHFVCCPAYSCVYARARERGRGSRSRSRRRRRKHKLCNIFHKPISYGIEFYASWKWLFQNLQLETAFCRIASRKIQFYSVIGRMFHFQWNEFRVYTHSERTCKHTQYFIYAEINLSVIRRPLLSLRCVGCPLGMYFGSRFISHLLLLLLLQCAVLSQIYHARSLLCLLYSLSSFLCIWPITIYSFIHENEKISNEIIRLFCQLALHHQNRLSVNRKSYEMHTLFSSI